MKPNPGSPSASATKDLEQHGWNLLNRKEYPQAIQEFARLFEQDPQNIAAFQGTVAALRLQHKFPEAEELLAKALTLHPRAAGILSERVWLSVAEKKVTDAISVLDELLKVKRDDDNLYILRTFLLRSESRFDEARTFLQEACSLFPLSLGLRNEQGWLAFYENHYDQALAVFEEILRRDPANELAWQGRIASLRMRGCYEEAVNLADQALAQFRHSPGLLSERAWIRFAQSCYEKAEEDFRAALERAPKDPGCLINLAWSLIRQEDPGCHDEAAGLCRQALDVAPELADAFGCLGIIAFRRGNAAEAEAYLRRSIQADPQHGFRADLGALYTAMGRYDEAAESLKEAARRNPDDAYAYVELGNLYLRSDRLKDAVRQYRRAAALDPRSPDAWRGLAIALIERNGLDEAEAVLRQAISRLDGPRRWELHLQLCRLLTQLGDDASDDRFYEEALKEVRAAIALQPGNAEPQFQAGIVRWKLEDYAGALDSFRRCLRADPHHLAAEVNAARMRALMRNDRRSARMSQAASLSVAGVVLLQLFVLWALRIWTAKIPDSMITLLVPILFGLLVVAVALPWLSRLKMTGLEAELSEPEPKNAVGSGPKGAVLSGATRTGPLGY
jgi:tetratricopeptide (TPR) repeat protein